MASELMQLSLPALAWTAGLVLVRVFCLLSVIPILRSALRPSGILILALVVAVYLLPELELKHAIELNLTTLFYWALQQALLGILWGIPLAIISEVLAVAARMIDFARGANYGEQVNPEIGSQASVLEHLMSPLTLACVFATGGYMVCVDLIAFSFKHFPLSQPLSVVGLGFLFESVRVYSHVFLAAVVIASPVLLFSFVVDLVSGISARMFQGRVSLAAEYTNLKLIAGLGLMLVTLNYELISFGPLLQSLISLRQFRG
ncbi:flagellar biosynthetic protein FliR [bacterium]|nr:flagellar biosynthetic protein FliR [bacterium]